MKKLSIVMGLAFLAMAAEARADAVDDKIKAQIAVHAAAWSSMDMTKIEPLYAPDSKLTWFDIAPLKFETWADYKAGVQKGLFDTLNSLKLTPNNDIKITRKGNLAVVTFTFVAELAPKKGAASKIDGRWTLILEKRKGKWIGIHEHVSAPLGGK